jgi:hypothetical protein
MLLGYMGASGFLLERRFLVLGVLIALVAGGISPAILSHPEHRYLAPFYFVYPLLAGYALACLYERFFSLARWVVDFVYLSMRQNV